jgi:hypothetical protein
MYDFTVMKNWVLVLHSFVGRCQRFGETYCLHLQGCSEKAEKWRAYIESEEQRLRVGSQSEGRNMGKGCGQMESLQVDYRGGGGGGGWLGSLVGK